MAEKVGPEDQDPQDVRIYVDGAVAKLEQPARPDTYRPISDPLWIWGAIAGPPRLEEWRLFWSAARRLDTGHLQIERVRQALNDAPASDSPAGRQAIHEVIGDAEMAVWAIDRAVRIALSLGESYGVETPFPEFVRQKRPLLTSLRNHYSHIDERALGLVRGKPDPTAEQAFEYEALVARRILTNGNDSLDIDEETTNLCIATRDYLVAAWIAVVERAKAKG